jgi:hypothetical protein
MLLAENFRSVNHRYAEEGEPAGMYEYREPKVGPIGYNPVQVLKAIHCLEYQSCEHPEWETSEARAFLKALEARTIRKIPGYDAAEWGPPPDPAELERRVKEDAARQVAKAAAILAEEEAERIRRRRGRKPRTA